MSVKSAKIYYALSLLFSKEQLESPSFLSSLGPEALKKAFRAKVMQCHPDLLHNLPESFRRARHERFIRVQQAYEFLTEYLETKREFGEDISWPHFNSKNLTAKPSEGNKKTIYAIGGAKGGIGKTVLSSNLAAALASLGKKVIAVDLDLGGANLHLHLGMKFPRLTLQHYFKRGHNLGDLCTETPISNLKMIAGDSSGLGMANILESQKAKLIKDLKELPADYVVVDLGGDTSYHMVDFFLAADERIAVTSPEPTSVLDVYNFLKVSLLRYLNKKIIFDLELENRKIGIAANRLKGIIFESTSTSGARRVKRLEELVHRVRTQEEKLGQFRPYLQVNMMEPDLKSDLVSKIAEIARQNLSVGVVPLPNIVFDNEVRRTVHYLVPVLLEKPESKAAQSIFNSVQTLLKPRYSRTQLCFLLQNSSEKQISSAFLQFLKNQSNFSREDEAKFCSAAQR